jgi:hypothetical protein
VSTVMKGAGRMAATLIGVGLTLATGFQARPADAAGCRRIVKVPVSIEQPGRYCLAVDVVAPVNAGVAIRVLADDVTIDLGGFSLSTQAQGSTAAGIVGWGRRGITVQNGRILGFARGIDLSGGDAGHHAVIGVYVAEARLGIRVGGPHCVVRENRVGLVPLRADLQAGGKTVNSVWIWVQGPSATVTGNDVINMGSGPTETAVGILASPGDDARISANRVTTDVGGRCGVCVAGESGALVQDNRVAGFDDGILIEPESAAASTDNVVGGGVGD